MVSSKKLESSHDQFLTPDKDFSSTCDIKSCSCIFENFMQHPDMTNQNDGTAGNAQAILYGHIFKNLIL